MAFTKGKLMATVALSTLTIAGTVGFGTYALFTASATTSANTFQAGYVQIDLQRDAGDNYPGPMFYSAVSDTNAPGSTAYGQYPYDTPKVPGNSYGGEALGGWTPGDSVSRTIEIISKGNLNATLTNISASIKSSYVAWGGTGATITGVTANSAGVDLDAYNEFISDMNVKIMDPISTTVVYNGPLSTLLHSGNHLQDTLSLHDNGDDTHLTFTVTLSKDADYKTEGKNIIIDFNFTATQSKNS